MSVACVDENFAYAIASSANRTLKIVGVNPGKYNASNTNWGAFPPIKLVYAGPTAPYNGFGVSDNAHAIVEIADNAFNHSANQNPFTEGPLALTSNIVRIGANAFNSVKITGVLTIPSSVLHVGDQAFSNMLIDEIVFENETNSDLLGGVVDSTRVLSKNKAGRTAADTVLNTLKVTKANPTMTGVTTIPNAVISNATIINATVTTENVTTGTLVSASIANLVAGGAASFSGNVSVSGQWNYTVQPKYNTVGLATQSYVDSKISLIDGNTASLTSTMNTLNKIASAIGGDPNFGLHVSQSQSNISQSTAIDTLLRTSQIVSLSSSLSTATVSLQTVDASIAAGIGSGSTARGSQIGSLSSSLSSATVSLQTVDASIAAGIGSGSTARNSQIGSLSSTLSTLVSERQANDISISSGIASAVSRRSLDVGSTSTALVNGGATLQSTDASLSSGIVSASTGRSGAVSSVSVMLSSAVPSLQTMDNAFLNALGSHTSNRASEVTSLTTARTSHVSALQAVKSTILPQISGGGLNQDGRTSTVFNLLGINVGESLMCVMGSGTFATNDKITIIYSATDYLRGTVTGVSGSNVTFTVTSKATSAVETQIYSTTGSFGNSGVLNSGMGNYIAPISPTPSFTNSSNYVVTTMSASQLRSVSASASFYMNLLDGSNTILGSSAQSAYYSFPFDYWGVFKSAFVPRNSTLKQQFVFTGGINVRLSFDVAGAAYTTMKGYAVHYSFGVVQIELPGTAESARISAVNSLSAGVASMLTSQLTANTSISSAIFNASSARSSAITSLSTHASASVSSLQSVSTALSNTQSTAVSDRITNVASLSNALYGNMSSLTSVNVSNSNRLSTEIVNRSVQIINAVNSLVNGAPSALDTLFEIANALTTGPSMYSTISNTDAALTSNVNARSSQMASLSGALSSSTLSLQTVDASLLSTNASNTSARSSQIVSLSGALSSSTLSLQTVDASLLSTNASNTSARSSQIVSLSNSIVGFVSTQVSFSGSLSSAISDATSTRIREISSLSSSLSTLATTLTGADTSLGNAFTSLSNGTQLSTLANLTEVDASVAGIMGLSTISALDTLGKIASAINLQPDIGTVIVSMTNAKGDASTVSSISAAATSCATQFSLSQLADAAGLKVSVSTTTSLQSVISGLSTSFGTLQSEVNSLTSSTAINSVVTADMVKTTRDLDELYVKNGFVNPDGSINYKINHLADPVINPGSSPSLAFAIDGNHQITAIRQVAAVLFDSLQTTMKYTSRGVEFTTSSSAFTNRVYTFSIDSSSIADYTANATAIVVTGQETSLRLAPVNALTIPKLALSSYTYAAPTVQTPYAATTWNDATGKISQVLRFNFELGVQKLQIDGTTYDVAGTTEKVDTLEYYPGASGTFSVRALNSTSKLQSPALTLSNVYNDYPQYAAPVLVGGTKTITLSGSTCTYSATFSSDANVVEVHAYNSGTYSKVQDLTPATANQFSVSITYDVSRIGQPLFKLRAATSASKRASDFSTVVLCEAFTFPPAVISSNLTYTNLNTTPKSFSVSVIYAVHPMATVVQVINAGTGAVLVTPNPAVSNGSVAFTFNFTEAQAISGMSFYVKTNTNSVGLESSSAAQVVTSQYDVPVIVAGTKVVMTSMISTPLFTISSSTSFPTRSYVQNAAMVLSNFPALDSLTQWKININFNAQTQNTWRPLIGSMYYINGSGKDWGVLISDTNKIYWTFNLNQFATNLSVSQNVNYQLTIARTTGNLTFVLKNADNSTSATFSNNFVEGGNNMTYSGHSVTLGGWSTSTSSQTEYGNGGGGGGEAMFFGTISLAQVTVDSAEYTHTANYTSASTSGIKVYDSTGTTLLQTVTTPGSGTFTVSATYDASKIGQTAFRLSSNSISTMRESALITVVGEDIPVHATPVISGGITYGTSGSDNTAQMNHTVSSVVDTVTVLKPDGSALPTGASFTQSIVSTTGASRVISVIVTFTNAVSPLSVAVFAELNAYGKRSAASASQSLLGQYAAPVISGTVSYTTVSAGSYTANMTHTVVSAVTAVQVRKASDGTVISGATASVSGTTATIAVPFTDATAPLNVVIVALANANGRESAVSATHSLLGQYAVPTISKTITLSGNTYTHTATYTSVSTAGVNVYNAAKMWNLTRTSSMLGHFNFIPTDNPTNVAFHVDFRVDRVILNYYNGVGWPVEVGIFDFHNLSIPTAFTVSFNPVSGFTLTYGPSNTVVTYPNYLNIAKLTGVSDTVQSAVGTAVLMPNILMPTPQSGASPFTITSKYDVSQIGQTLSKVSSKGDSTMRESALITVVGEDIPVHATPVISGGITYGTSGSDNTAQMNYTVSSVVDMVTVLKPDGSALPTGASFTQSIVSTTGASRVISVIVTFTHSVAPLSVAVFAELNASGKRSAASASQTLLGALVASYSFDSNGDDSCGNNNLTNVSAVTFNASDFKRGSGAASFNGNNYFQIANDGRFSPDNFTVAFWIKPVAGSVYQAIASCRNSPGLNIAGWIIYLSSTDLQFWTGTSSSSWSGDGANLLSGFGNVNTWVHLCFTLNKSTGSLQVYVNGTLCTTVSRTYVNNATTNLRIGAGANEQGALFNVANGTLIDDFRFYNKVLSAAEIASLCGEEFPVHATPVISGSITYGTSGSDNTAQMNYTVSSMVDTVTVLKPDGSALPTGASFTQSIVSTTGASRVISVIVTFTIAVSPLSVAVFAELNAYGKRSAASASQTLLSLSQYAAPVSVAGTKVITLSGSTYTHTANYTSASTSGIKVYDSTGTTLLQTVTTPGSGTFTVSATYDASKIGQTAFVLKSAANATGLESVALTVVGENIPPPAIVRAGIVPTVTLSTLQTFGSNGSSNGLFSTPRGIATDATGNIYVADSGNHRIQKFDRNGNYLSQFGQRGSSYGDFEGPRGIAIDAAGNIYVVDAGNYRIQIFTNAGSHIRTIYGTGADPQRLLGPRGIAIDAAGNIYVTDEPNTNLIRVFNSTGGYIRSFGPTGSADGYLYGAEGIAIDATGNIYVADTTNNRVQKFDSNGNYLAKFGSYGVDDGQLDRPTGIAIDASGKIIVADGSNRIKTFTNAGMFVVNSFGSYQAYSPPKLIGIAINASGQILVSDINNGDYRVQIIGVLPPAIARAGTLPSDTLGTLSTFGSLGADNGQFSYPSGVATDAAGNIYVAESDNHRIQKFNSAGTHVSSFGSQQGSANGQFNAPRGIAIDATGNIYVADTDNNRIQMFTSAGGHIRSFGSQGSANGQLAYPRGIAIDATGNIYVADSGNNRIQMFTSTGTHVSSFGTGGTGNGEFNTPSGIAIDATGNIYVADSGNNRIQMFTSTGTHVSSFGSVGTGNGEFNTPRGIAIDASGKFVVADTMNHRIQLFTSTRTHVSSFGSFGTGNGNFNRALAIAINASGEILVVDQNNHRVQIVDIAFDLRGGAIDDGAYLIPMPNGAKNSYGTIWDEPGGHVIVHSANTYNTGAHVIGANIAMSADGTQMVVGSPFFDGSSYVASSNYGIIQILGFNSSGSTWTLNGSDSGGANNYKLGEQVAISGDGKVVAATVNVGVGQIKLYKNGSNYATLSGATYSVFSGFGMALSLSGNGRWLALSGNSVTTQNTNYLPGYIKVINISDGTYSQWGQDILGPDSTNAVLGSQLIISADGKKLIASTENYSYGGNSNYNKIVVYAKPSTTSGSWNNIWAKENYDIILSRQRDLSASYDLNIIAFARRISASPHTPTTYIYNTETNTLINSIVRSYSLHNIGEFDLAISGNGKVIAQFETTNSTQYNVYVYDIATLAQIGNTISRTGTMGYNCISLSGAGTKIGISIPYGTPQNPAGEVSVFHIPRTEYVEYTSSNATFTPVGKTSLIPWEWTTTSGGSATITATQYINGVVNKTWTDTFTVS